MSSQPPNGADDHWSEPRQAWRENLRGGGEPYPIEPEPGPRELAAAAHARSREFIGADDYHRTAARERLHEHRAAMRRGDPNPYAIDQ